MAKKNDARAKALKAKLAKLRQKQDEDVANKDKGNLRRLNIFNLKDYPDIEFLKPEEGTEIRDGIYTLKLDILPFEINTDVYSNPNLGKGDIDYVFDFWVHRGVGVNDDSIICLKRTYGKACPICEEMEGLKKQGADEDKINALSPSHKVAYNVIDLNRPEEGVKIFLQSFALFQRDGWMQEKLIKEAEGEEIIYVADLDNGRTIKCRAVKQKFKGNPYYKFTSIDFLKRKETYDASILDDTIPLGDVANILPYDEIRKIHFEIEDSDESGEEENSKRNAHVEDNDDNDDDGREDGGKEVGEDKFDDMEGDELEEYITENELDITIKRSDSDDDIRNKIRECEDENSKEEAPSDKEEEKKEEKPKRARGNRTRKSGSKKDEECPHGKDYGKDCDLYDECDDCDIHDECSKAMK